MSDETVATETDESTDAAVENESTTESETTEESPTGRKMPVRNLGEAGNVITLQQTLLGGEFKDVDLRTKLFHCLRQTGTPQVTTKTVPTKTKVKNEDGTETIVEGTKEEQTIVYNWDPNRVDVTPGEPHKSLTGALQNQKYLAKAYETVENGSMDVREYLKEEYGVWYVTDPKGILEGYRYSVGMSDKPPAPPKPVKEKKVKEPKPTHDADGNPIVPAKRGRKPKDEATAAAASKASEAAAKSDDVAVEEPD